MGKKKTHKSEASKQQLIYEMPLQCISDFVSIFKDNNKDL